jgi:hypothetical protein
MLRFCLVLCFFAKLCDCSIPVFQQELKSGNVCTEKICKFHLTLRDEISMTRKVRPGRIWKSGETFLLELQNGSLLQKLGTFYEQETYHDLAKEIVNITDDVITADGVRRPIITINDVFPGPTLEVMEGSEVRNK